MDNNLWKDGIMGVIIGDALGVPVEFTSREERQKDPVTGMREYGTYHQPKGTWSDDSSMTLATLDSIIHNDGLNYEDLMGRFRDWRVNGSYTPYGSVFDIGITCAGAIEKYTPGVNPLSCGASGKWDNGNGSLMRILPVCLYAYKESLPDEEAVKIVHEVSGLTHNHIRSKMACGLYYFCVRSILNGNGDLQSRLQGGMDEGFAFYERDLVNRVELSNFGRLRDLREFSEVSENDIKSGGYVVDSLEAAVWTLLRTKTFKDCVLLAVNLGSDTDTTGAIAGGLAGLYYGYVNIPKEWLEVIHRREWIEDLCGLIQKIL